MIRSLATRLAEPTAPFMRVRIPDTVESMVLGSPTRQRLQDVSGVLLAVRSQVAEDALLCLWVRSKLVAVSGWVRDSLRSWQKRRSLFFQWDRRAAAEFVLPPSCAGKP